MNCETMRKDLKIIGSRFTRRFEEFPVLITELSKTFSEQYSKVFNDPDFLRTVIYEPKKDDTQESGDFYIGAVVDQVPEQVPNDMEVLHLQGEYAFLRDSLDFSKMGDYYNTLVNWVRESDLELHPTEHIIEIYHSSKTNAGELEINLPLVTKKY